MDINENFENGINTISLSGRLDANSSLRLNKAINASINNNKLNIIIDCENLSEISSAGIDFLLSCRESIKNKNGEFFLNNISSDIANIFSSLGVSNIIYGYQSENLQETQALPPNSISNIEDTIYEFYDIKRNLVIDNTLEAYGNPNKFLENKFQINDTFLLQYKKNNIGLGLGDLSCDIDNNEKFFGEYVNIGSYTFHIPSCTDAIPDYQITTDNVNEKNSCKMNTLYGLRAQNSFRNFTSFYREDKKATTITDVIKTLMSYVNSKAIHFTIFGNVSSFYGTRLTTSPFQNKEQNLLNQKNIQKNFQTREGDCFNGHTVALVGFAICDADPIVQNFLKLYDEEISLFAHMHCIIFDKQHLNTLPQDDIDNNTSAILSHGNPIDLYHLFKKNDNEETSFYNGICYFDSLSEFKTGEF